MTIERTPSTEQDYRAIVVQRDPSFPADSVRSVEYQFPRRTFTRNTGGPGAPYPQVQGAS